jgi:hypothetical protein
MMVPLDFLPQCCGNCNTVCKLTLRYEGSTKFFDLFSHLFHHFMLIFYFGITHFLLYSLLTPPNTLVIYHLAAITLVITSSFTLELLNYHSLTLQILW